ncbi:MAG: SPFH domain-containing protein [Leptolyngbya sp. BL-A-14]
MLLPRFYFLKADEQLLVEDFTQQFVVNGPTFFLARPLLKITRRKALTLGPTDYVRIRNRFTGELRNQRGPGLHFLDANEEVAKKLTALPLSRNQYVKIINQQTAVTRMVRGETLVYLDPSEELLGGVQEGINIDDETAVLVRTIETGQLQLITEPQVFFPDANQTIEARRKPVLLKQNQYVKVIDKSTGAIRVVRGECRFYPEPTEELLGSIQDGVNVDEHTAVLIRDTESAQLDLVTAPQVFIPGPTQEVVRLQQRILLEDHEAVVIKDRLGQYQIRRGTDPERAFFLAPYAQLVEFCWSRGVHKDKRDLTFTHIDSRPKFMSYEFEVRTQDNVELVLAITLFWQIMQIEAMIRTTDDATGDVCAHARSSIIQAVSQTTLERFLSSFNDLVQEAVLNPGDGFYQNRGVQIHSTEVRSIACKDPETQRILMEIIQETTNRLNQLQKQESSNEVQLRQLEGDIAAEQMKGQLLDLRQEHAKTEATTQGAAEAIRVKAFLEGLGEQLSSEDKLFLFNLLRKQDAIAALSAGTAQLYFTPADVNLSIEARPLSGGASLQGIEPA